MSQISFNTESGSFTFPVDDIYGIRPTPEDNTIIELGEGGEITALEPFNSCWNRIMSADVEAA